MNFQAARMAMVESQIRPNGVRDARILSAFAAIPREIFVPDEQRALAYRDEAVRVPPARPGLPARYLLAPVNLARLLQQAAPDPSSRVLDIGGATGYSAAVLAELCAEVFALEASEELAELARAHLSRAGVEGVKVVAGNLVEGLKAHQPYDLILLNGAAAAEPRRLFEQLREGGRLAAILGDRRSGHALLYTKTAGTVSGRAIFDAGAEILPGFEAEPHFVF